MWWASQMPLTLKNLSANVGNRRDAGSIPELRRSPRQGNDNPFQYSCLENHMDRWAWRALVYKVTKSWAQMKWLTTVLTSYIWYTSIYSHSTGCLFILLMVSFAMQSFLVWCSIYLWQGAYYICFLLDVLQFQALSLSF